MIDQAVYCERVNREAHRQHGEGGSHNAMLAVTLARDYLRTAIERGVVG